MHYPTAKAFIRAKPSLPAGIVGIVLCESAVHADHSAQALVDRGVGTVIAIGAHGGITDPGVPVVRIDEAPELHSDRAILNTVFRALDGRWVVWLWNGEFLLFPFYETRTLADLTQFLADERRRALYAYAIDLYSRDMPPPAAPPDTSALYFDRIGYHAFPKDGGQLRLYGSLGWRFEELCPPALQPIGRTGLLKVGPDTVLDRERLFGQTDLDSVACPWHHNPTAAIFSLRRTQRILAHPGFGPVADRLFWDGSTQCQWSSRQLLELGMIEPGQWF